MILQSRAVDPCNPKQVPAQARILSAHAKLRPGVIPFPGRLLSCSFSPVLRGEGWG